MSDRPIRWSPDLDAVPFTPRWEPKPIPAAGIFAMPRVCVKINAAWVSHLIGALEVLNVDDAWIGNDAQRFAARQQIEALIAALAIGMCSAEEGQGGDVIVDVREENGELQYTRDGVTWTTFATLIPGVQGEPGAPGADGAQGPQGEPGPAGADGADGEDGLTFTQVQTQTLSPGDAASGTVSGGTLYLGIPRGQTGATGAAGATGATGPQGATGPRGADGECLCDEVGAPSEPPDGDLLKCNVAMGLGELLYNYVRDYLDDLAAANAAVQGVLTFIGNLPIIDELGVDALISIGQAALNIGVASLKATVDTTYKETAMQCGLYCVLGDDGLITQSVLNAWKDKIVAYGGIAIPFVNGMIDAVTIETWRRRAMIYSQQSANCDLCDCEEEEDCAVIDETLPVDARGVIAQFSQVSSQCFYEVTVTGFFMASTNQRCDGFYYSENNSPNWDPAEARIAIDKQTGDGFEALPREGYNPDGYVFSIGGTDTAWLFKIFDSYGDNSGALSVRVRNEGGE